ncbi:hypothetical protein LC55x_0667 [Lysobacter capsici]|nr:hypothetical protein LC55x_0667 [Lysobacter capsici]
MRFPAPPRPACRSVTDRSTEPRADARTHLPSATVRAPISPDPVPCP